MYLIDTNVISEMRKHSRADPGVRGFFERASRDSAALYLSVVTIGELRRGVELIRLRGDLDQASRLERWLEALLGDYENHILGFDADAAQLWGVLRAPNPGSPLDKQIAATAMIHGLTVVTRNQKHFVDTGAAVLNPFNARA
jgi:predicted nucleic acid-binding protein